MYCGSYGVQQTIGITAKHFDTLNEYVAQPKKLFQRSTGKGVIMGSSPNAGCRKQTIWNRERASAILLSNPGTCKALKWMLSIRHLTTNLQTSCMMWEQRDVCWLILEITASLSNQNMTRLSWRLLPHKRSDKMIGKSSKKGNGQFERGNSVQPLALNPTTVEKRTKTNFGRSNRSF